MKTIILILILTLSNQLIAKNKIYKWTDANGNVHFSQDKPQNAEVKEVNVSVGKSKSKITNQKPQEPNDVDNNKKSDNEIAFDEYNKTEKERVAKQQKKSNCKIAKKNHATLQQTVRVRKLDPNTGDYVRMTDTQRMSSLKAAKKLISDVCK